MDRKKIVFTRRERAPPRRAFEPPPFLCVSNTFINNNQKSDPDGNNERIKTPESRSYVRSRSVTPISSRSLKVPANTPAPFGLCGVGTQSSGSGVSASVCSAEWNKMVPRKHKALAKKARQVVLNGHVRSPFKQDKNDLTDKTKVVMPDQKLKEDTAAATYHVAKSIAMLTPERERIIAGRLLKARLKPLGVVNQSGPTIHHCRGIVADTRNYGASMSKTLQRRRYILSNMNRDFLKQRPRTAESIHHTSVASDITDNREIELKQDFDYLEVNSCTSVDQCA